MTPTQLRAFGSNLDSWYICATINRQSSPYWRAYLRTTSSNGEIVPATPTSAARTSCMRLAFLKYFEWILT